MAPTCADKESSEHAAIPYGGKVPQTLLSLTAAGRKAFAPIGAPGDERK
jgi:hypothetical protein